MAELLRTPLESFHEDAGGRMVEFAGWRMPVQYASGILGEHEHVRTSVGIFDTCHMGEFLVTGPGAAEDLGRLVTSSVERLAIGQCRYGLLLNQEAGILDDLIVYRLADQEFYVVVNAGTVAHDFEWIGDRISDSTELTNLSETTGKIDVQGPQSRAALASLCASDLAGLGYFRCICTEVCGQSAIVSRTGYTGELGYEVYVDVDHTASVWSALLDQPEVKPAGLGARDTLRLEVGYRLYGQDMDATRSPLEADLMFSVSMEKDFLGRKALAQQMQTGDHDRLVGFVMSGRRAGRHGQAILVDGESAGVVTSGSFAPSVGVAVGMGYVDGRHKLDVGDVIEIDVGRTRVEATVAAMPFYDKGTARTRQL